MLVIISPAKSFDFSTQTLPFENSTPQFLERSSKLIEICKNFTEADLKSLMKVSDSIAKLNVARYKDWNFEHNLQNSKMALFAFNGDVYQGLDAKTLANDALYFATEHLRILSGLYGVLKPFDLIQPYRLEMGTKLQNSSGMNLYYFWQDVITEHFNELLGENKVLVNLASDEYFKAINTKKLKAQIIKPVFLDQKNGVFKQIGIYAKRARGLMTRFILTNQLTNISDLKHFDYENYRFNEELSNQKELVFVR